MWYRGIVLWMILLSIVLYAEKSDIPAKSIYLKGDTYFSESEIQDAIGIDHKKFFQFWKDDEPRLKTALIPTLEASLKSFYVSEGFYDAVFQIEETQDHIDVQIEAHEPVMIRDINVTSDFDLSELITLQTEERFRAEDFVKNKENVVMALLNEGYCSYELDSKAYVDLSKRSVDIVFKLTKGGICTFGKLSVDGLESIDESIVYSRVQAKEGQTYSLDRISQSYDNLYLLETFDSVVINTDRKFYNVVPVDIHLKETDKPYHTKVGLGYDTYVGMRVQGEVVKKNFMGDAQKLTLKSAWSQEEQFFESGFFKPVFFEFFDLDLDLGAKIGYSDLIYSGFKEKKGYLRSYLESHFDRWNLQFGLALENIDINAYENLAEGETPKQAVTEGNFLLTYPYVKVVYDARDSKLNPKKGYYLSAYLEYGLSSQEGASDYIKGLLEGRVIYTFGKVTLATVAKIGSIEVEEGGLPESKFFFAGGSYSNRAYGYNELGVILSPEEDTIYGASSWMNFTVEANFPVWGDVYGAVFTDNTMLTEESFDFSGEMITSAGAGLRYMTPIGPFKIDMGMNVHDTSQYRILFQVGHSF